MQMVNTTRHIVLLQLKNKNVHLNRENLPIKIMLAIGIFVCFVFTLGHMALSFPGSYHKKLWTFSQGRGVGTDSLGKAGMACSSSPAPPEAKQKPTAADRLL